MNDPLKEEQEKETFFINDIEKYLHLWTFKTPTLNV